MLFVYGKHISNTKPLLQCFADCIQTSITGGLDGFCSIRSLNGNRSFNVTRVLYEMAFRDIEPVTYRYIMGLKNSEDISRRQLTVFLIGNTLNKITNLFSHILWQGNTKVLL